MLNLAEGNVMHWFKEDGYFGTLDLYDAFAEQH